MRRVLAAALALALLSPATASALTYREQRAIGVAAKAWRGLPCGGHIEIVREVMPNRWDSAMVAPPCRIIYDTAALTTAYWPTFCTVIVHEVGHLLGYGHSSDPTNVMYPTPLERHPYWRCQHSAEWQPSADSSTARPRALQAWPGSP